MKLFTILAGAIGLAHAAEEVAETADAWQSASSADKKIWSTDILHAQSTMKQIKNKSCKLPKGKNLNKLGTPRQVSKHYYKLKNGNSRATYQFKFSDGTTVYAGNSNVGQKGGNWKVYCYRQGNNIPTQGPHQQHDLSRTMTSRLASIFKSIDKDGSGTITSGGAYSGLSQIFPAYSLPNYEQTLETESIKMAGKDKVVDLDDFECVAKKLNNIKKVYDEFRQYDKNHDNKISRSELETALMQFYFKDVAQKGLHQTPTIKANVKKIVDNIIKSHDKNHDSQVSWNEFEMDAFVEEHYRPSLKCKTSKTPLNQHAINVVQNLIKKFHGNPKSKEMSHSMWYQVTSMLTEQAVDTMTGPDKHPSLGCWPQSKVTQNIANPKKPGFGPNGGKHWGYTPKPGSGLLGGRRVLLDRMLQQKPKPHKVPKTMSTTWQALVALHKQADKNRDNKISDHEILDIFQGVRDHLSTSDFGGFLDLVNRLHGPVNCKVSHDCGKCTAPKNAGLCGWFGESQQVNNNPFGGYQAQKSNKGSCKFVDRSLNAEQNQDATKLKTCSTQCKKKTRFRPAKKPQH